MSERSATPWPTGLPTPDPALAAHEAKVRAFLIDAIRSDPRGALPFETWMDLALYAPGLGYYVAADQQFASTRPTGDFTTAPELTPLFGHTLARQVAQILHASESLNILEFGAGSGALAHAVLSGLHELGVNARYHILELSPALQAQQRKRLSAFQEQTVWLNQLPDSFEGCVLANEVLDAMPLRMFRIDDTGVLGELYVTIEQQDFVWQVRPADDCLNAVVSTRLPSYTSYQSEVNLRAEAWVRQLGDWLRRGVALLLDYGFPQHEYYHPQRAQGTLMCHFRHHSHAEPLILPGVQDITAHIDFSAMAQAATAGGLEVLGYTSQARFLLNTGLVRVWEAQQSHQNERQQQQSLSAMQTLLSEAEMGELFKVLAVGRQLSLHEPLVGFSTGDRSFRL